MGTAPLKSFATWARTALIREVTARIAVVLAPSSPERVEQPNAVAALEKAVNAAGGGEPGRAAVADKVAYTWFNRIIALRFMDANGYTGIGVVSPERGREGGQQPEVLAEAKRGNIDIMVVTRKSTVEAITGLLNGTRRSDDPQGEAYALLLAAYCRFWNRSMPFMFEREGDYTELLIPANLLADDSVLARSVAVLTEEVCQDVEVIGWLYQFYISERKGEVFAGFKNNGKAGAAEIPAATQLFTPHWIVRYLVENSLGRLWLLNRPASRLADQMDYYIAPVDEETDYLKVARAEELKIIDPACGSGHMLTYAFDLLYAIYEEEGYAPSDIPGLILANNLYGTEIDPRAGALAAFALAMKARSRQRTFFNKQVEPNVCVLEPISFTPTELGTLVTRNGDRRDEETFWNSFQHADTFGSLIQPREELIELLRRHLDANELGETDLIGGPLFERARRALVEAEYLSARYHVVVANPPYMGSGNMDARMAEFAKERYPCTRGDLFAMFIERCGNLTARRGLVAMVTMQSWMFLSGFEKMRRSLLGSQRIAALAHLGTGAFDTLAGEVVSTAAFVLETGAGGSGQFLRLVDLPDSRQKAHALSGASASHDLSFERSSDYFESLPGASIIYWFDDALGDMFATYPAVTSRYSPMNGMTTGSNARFVRYWYEVSSSRTCLDAASEEAAGKSGARWFPYNKGGGGARRWYGNAEYVLDWEDGGRRIADYGHAFLRGRRNYFRPLITWSKINTGRPGFRSLPEGFLFDVAGMGLFADDEVGAGQFSKLLGYLNSSVAVRLLAGLSPTLNVESGQVGSLPLPDLEHVDGEIVTQLVSLQRDEWDSRETSWGFRKPALLDAFPDGGLGAAVLTIADAARQRACAVADLEAANELAVARALGKELTQETDVENGANEDGALTKNEIVLDLISFAVGCMFGRYSLDEPGLILANQGDTLHEYLAKVPSPSFTPDKDDVIPIVDGDWFEDDIVARFRQFLRVAFGERHFEENLRFVTESLGVKDLRDYFVKSFYKDHVQRYKKRPIYWLFASPKGSFNALIYMHRYTPSAVSTVLNEYLREFKAKLGASRQHHERLAIGAETPRQQAAARKEVDRLRKVLLELDEYEHDVLYPLATQQVQIDLDDGVKSNYPKLGAALKKIPGLEASDG